METPTTHSLLAVALLSLLCVSCELSRPEDLTGERSRQRRRILYYAPADRELHSHQATAIDALLYDGALPAGTELLLLSEEPGSDPMLSRRTGSVVRRERLDEAGLPELPAHSGALLSALLDLSAEGVEPGGLHLILSGRSSFSESLEILSGDQGSLGIVEIARILRELDSGALGSVTLASSHAATLEVLYELRELEATVIAAPGPLSLAGLDGSRLIDALERGVPVPGAILESLEEAHRGIPGAAVGAYDPASVASLATELEALLPLLEAALSDLDGRLGLREALVQQSLYGSLPGPAYLPIDQLAREVTLRFPGLTSAAESLEAAVSEAVVGGWSNGGARIAPALYYVSLAQGGEPENHEVAYLPEAFGPPKCEFVLESRWPPRPSRQEGILFFLWYDLTGAEVSP